MIPLSKDTILTWTDEEDGAVIEFVPATGEVGYLLHKAIGCFEYDVTPFVAEVTKEVERESGGMWDTEKMETEIRNRSIARARNAQKEKENLGDRENKAMYTLVDWAVLSCTPKDGKKIVFNKDATHYFTYLQVLKLFTVYMKLNSLTGEERKN